MFITGADRAIRVQCQYQAAEKHVGANFGVNDLPWNKHAEPIAMPVCRYDILAESADGPLLSSASVGQRVYHKWTCETSTPEFFCMRVHSCTVEDGHGSSVSILNEAGCAVDDVLLRNLNYTGLVAGQTALVYKYADHDTLFFQCQVSITVRDPRDVNELARGCPRPVCDSGNETPVEVKGIQSRTDSELAVLQVRQPRESNVNKTASHSQESTLPPFEVLDVTANLLATDNFDQPTQSPSESPSKTKTICLPGPALAGIIFIIALVSISTIVALIHRIKHRRRLYVIN
uniref:ZP domain-containing protein n=1 Tax=Panagrellus redivivus TaxID=6233 RepID=A0A7E4VUB6_PANRE